METSDRALDSVLRTLKQVQTYGRAASRLTFDQETICPPEAMEEAGEAAAFLSDKAYRLLHAKRFVEAAEALYARREELSEFPRTLAEQLHREWMRTKNITPEMSHRFDLITNRAFVRWVEAKKAADYSIFMPSLTWVRDMEIQRVKLMEEVLPDAYDNLLDQYERGMTSAQLDELFGCCRERLVPLIERVRKSPRTIRTDFLRRPVPVEAQQKMARWLLEEMGFDFSRGLFSTSEHPFTDSVSPDDTRLTTSYDVHQFSSNIYSILHEGGHALFDQNSPREHVEWHIDGGKTLGQHESVSRFYENVLGRSEAFIHFLYPKAQALFPDALSDVTERELYEAVNAVIFTPIRLEADELTYPMHIVLRYELERDIISGKAPIADLPRLWADKSEALLGVRPKDDREGVLQDVHWTGGFGYFPTYALGNFYNAMYHRAMRAQIDVDGALREGNFAAINDWMREHVWARADLQSPQEWIQSITGRSLTADDFLDAMEEKYTELYRL